jgi:hypothetical protein
VLLARLPGGDQRADDLRIDDLAKRLSDAGLAVDWDDELAPTRRFYTADPWGNRLELIAV